MPNHPNRSADRPARNPSPAEVRAAREAAGLTQAQAAALVHASARNWQQWEQSEGASSARRMHPGLWELFRVKAALSGLYKGARVTVSERAKNLDAEHPSAQGGEVPTRTLHHPAGEVSQ